MISSHCRVYGALRSVYLFFALLPVLVLTLAQASSAQEQAYREELIAAGRSAGLSGDRYWRTLVHYKKKGGGWQSLVDDPKFFLSPSGKDDPEAELEATLAAFFEDPSLGDDHPQCRFPARFSWLAERLAIDHGRLPEAACAKYRENMANIKMKSAVLVFPAAHGNGPASMFGHTLIRIDSSVPSDLLSHAVNYAALAKDTNGFIYAFKGLFGLYKGYYSILPYYDKIREYNNIEQRDMWEYYLNLSEDEIRRMVMHIWEIRDTYSDYYFFTENCSYNLLFMLEAARPTLDLTDPYRERLRFWVIPADTVRAVLASGLVDRVKYRPSLATRITTLADTMSDGDQEQTIAVADGRTSPKQITESDMTPERKTKVLDLAAELAQYRFAKQETTKDAYLKQYLAVLGARSTLGKQSSDLSAAVDPPVSPERGHLPGKIDIGGGWRSLGFQETREWFTEFQWRPAYHDLMDPDAGYVEGAQINFFDLRARYYPEDDSLRFQSLRLLDILSLAPRDRFFLPVSWKVTTGIDRAIMPDGSDRLIYRINPAGGGAYKRRGIGTAYFMLESDIQLSNVYDEHYAFGLGPTAGIFTTLTGWWKVNLTGQALFYPLGETHRTFRGTLRQSFFLSTNSAVELGILREQTFRHDLTEYRAGWNLYF